MNELLMHANFGEVRFAQFGYNTVDSICKLASETGYDGIEFRSSVPLDRKDMEFKDFLAEIKEAKKKYGIKTLVFGVGVGASASSDKEEREKSKVLSSSPWATQVLRAGVLMSLGYD